MSWHPWLFGVTPPGCPLLLVTAFECDHALDGFMEGDMNQALIDNTLVLARDKVREKASFWGCKVYDLLVPRLAKGEGLPSMLCIAHLVGADPVETGPFGDFSVATVGFFVQPEKDSALVALFEAGLAGLDWAHTAVNFDY